MFLDRDHSIAPAGYSRWRVPPAALAIHLAIGQAYAFSVFNLPLSTLVGIDKAAPTDWKLSTIGWIFSTAIVCLGLSAFTFGRWLEDAGPRKAMFCAAVCFAGGFCVAALGVQLHQIWIIYLGYGVIGGIGLGLGYISPVSTLIKWFPDKPGMATGLAIMGFGGGAMIGAPLANLLMTHFRTPTDVGVAQTFLCLGVIYFVFMMGGAFGYRVPPSHWQPEGWAPPPPDTKSMITHGQVRRWVAVGTPQFWLIWAVLFLNVSAGIGVIGMASPMLQEIFGGALIGHPDIGFTALDDSQKKAIAAIAAGFAGLISLFNIAGRFFWASMSDRIGRKNTYFTFFLLGIACYALSPWAAHAGSKVLFVAFVCIILSMYGGGFATVPAYLADMFGTLYVGAIHGVLLTAWSAAGILGPVIVNYVREFEIAAGVPRDLVYDRIFYALACLLVLGFIANLLIRPVNRKRFMSVEEVVAVTGARAAEHAHDASRGIGRGGLTPAAVPAWLVVGIPIAWGVWVTVQTAMKLFG